MKIKPMTIITGVFLALGIGLSVKFIFFPTKSVPSEFSEARLRGAALAQKIVVLAGASLQSLEEISVYDKQGNSPEALIAISRQLIKNRELQEHAVQLASQLEKMARYLPEIKPGKARLVASEAVSAEVALVSRLVSYNDFLRQLFEVLRGKFNNTLVNPDGQVQDLIKKINEEAEAINELDKKFGDALVEFDKIVL